MADRPVPLSAPEQVLDLGDGTITTVTAIDATESCFAGHYPDFPILPGVLLIETVQVAVRRYATDRLGQAARLQTLDTVRFFAPVGPGDEVTTECALTRDGDQLQVTARCRTGRGRAASVRATYGLTGTS
jgi:3-hydroxyacyl-[acyl-carrier-protein] dehydratase